MTSALRVDLIDISHFQSGLKFDWQLARKNGLKGVYHKATEGTTYVDSAFNKRRAELFTTGLPFGAYHFARPSPASQSAGYQAKHFLSMIGGGMQGDLLPMLDLETSGGLNAADLDDWAVAFVKIVIARIGAAPVIYTHFDLPKTSILAPLLWVARYSNTNAAPHTPKGWSKYAVRQFSNGAYGVPRNVSWLPNAHLDFNQLEVPIGDLLLTHKHPDPKPAKPKRRGSAIDTAIANLEKANRPSQKQKIDAALKILESIPYL